MLTQADWSAIWYKCLVCHRCFQYPDRLIRHRRLTECGIKYQDLIPYLVETDWEEQSDAEESPTEESPTEESPTEESPTDESPTDESPTEETPDVIETITIEDNETDVISIDSTDDDRENEEEETIKCLSSSPPTTISTSSGSETTIEVPLIPSTSSGAKTTIIQETELTDEPKPSSSQNQKQTKAKAQLNKTSRCYFCKKNFGWYSLLENHINVHTEEKPMSRKKRNSRFSFSQHLKTNVKNNQSQRQQFSSVKKPQERLRRPTRSTVVLSDDDIKPSRRNGGQNNEPNLSVQTPQKISVKEQRVFRTRRCK